MTKQGGSPYTQASQQGAKINRNSGRLTRKAGRCEAPPNSLVALLSLSIADLALKLIDLGFFKSIKRCPKCGCCFGGLRESLASSVDCTTGARDAEATLLTCRARAGPSSRRRIE